MERLSEGKKQEARVAGATGQTHSRRDSQVAVVPCPAHGGYDGIEVPRTERHLDGGLHGHSRLGRRFQDEDVDCAGPPGPGMA